MSFRKNAFSQSVFELETLHKEQNNEQQYAKSMAPLPRFSDALPPCDVINVILGKTAVTPSFFKLKTSNQN